MDKLLPDSKSGQLIMLLEVLKIASKVFNPDVEEVAYEKNNEILIYDTLVLNVDKEDSLFFRVKVINNNTGQNI
jgi:hypothetical protein